MAFWFVDEFVLLSWCCSVLARQVQDWANQEAQLRTDFSLLNLLTFRTVADLEEFQTHLSTVSEYFGSIRNVSAEASAVLANLSMVCMLCEKAVLDSEACTPSL